MTSLTVPFIAGVEFRGEALPGAAEVLSPEAGAFIAELSRRFEATRQELLARRQQRQQEIVDGRMPDFLRETANVRSGNWRVAPIPRDLLDRRVEITGPVD